MFVFVAQTAPATWASRRPLDEDHLSADPRHPAEESGENP
jgi:hypothetical protein